MGDISVLVVCSWLSTKPIVSAMTSICPQQVILLFLGIANISAAWSPMSSTLFGQRDCQRRARNVSMRVGPFASALVATLLFL